MNCEMDLKAYVVGEVTPQEKGLVENHVRGCQSCREELDRLNLTRSALASLEDQEIPRRIAFVSDRVFEPRWWQTMWRSGPVMGFAAAALLAAAILVHGFLVHSSLVHGWEARPAAVDAAQIEKQVESRINARVLAAVNEAQARQSAEFTKVLNATESRYETQRHADLATVQQAAEYYEKQMGRFVVASNEGPAQ
jgi:anti-sigma factor RsiW